MSDHHPDQSSPHGQAQPGQAFLNSQGQSGLPAPGEFNPGGFVLPQQQQGYRGHPDLPSLPSHPDHLASCPALPPGYGLPPQFQPPYAGHPPLAPAGAPQGGPSNIAQPTTTIPGMPPIDLNNPMQSVQQLLAYHGIPAQQGLYQQGVFQGQMTGSSASTTLPSKEGEDKKEEAEKEENVDKEAEKDKKVGKEEKSAEEKKVDADKADGEKSPTPEAGWTVTGAVGKAAGNFVVTQAVRHYGKVVVLLPTSMIF